MEYIYYHPEMDTIGLFDTSKQVMEMGSWIIYPAGLDEFWIEIGRL